MLVHLPIYRWAPLHHVESRHPTKITDKKYRFSCDMKITCNREIALAEEPFNFCDMLKMDDITR